MYMLNRNVVTSTHAQPPRAANLTRLARREREASRLAAAARSTHYMRAAARKKEGTPA